MNCLTTIHRMCLVVNSFRVFSVLFYVLQFDIHRFFNNTSLFLKCRITVNVILTYSFSRAALTKHHKFSGFK